MCKSVEVSIGCSVIVAFLANFKMDQREELVDNFALTEQVYPPSMSSF